MVAPALLALADGTLFHGTAIGAEGTAVGEVVFNTAMTGYQEILTDPSYLRQLVTLTCPHIGNTGVNPEDVESGAVQAAGLIIRDLPLAHSSWRATASLGDYLQAEGVVAMADLDTRALTRHIRSHGAQPGALVAGDAAGDSAAAVALACGFPGLAGMDLAREATCAEPWSSTEALWQLGSGHPAVDPADAALHVVAYDFGVKRNILRMLVARGCRVTVVPATTPFAEVQALAPDGVFFSNGPGDPEPCSYAIEAAQACLAARLPLFGICLGHQILALACGGRTVKMPFGHHGANHPVQDLRTGTVMITSQNHGFAVDAESLPETVEVTHKSLFDGTLQGIRHRQLPAFSFQGHPEASPGPHDCAALFDHFITLMQEAR